MNIVVVVLANGSDHQRYGAYIANGLAREHNITLVCTSRYDRSLMAASPVRVIDELDCRQSRVELQALSPTAWLRMLKGISAAAPDIIHFIAAHPLNLGIAAYFRAVPRIFTIHDVEPHPGEKIGLAIRLYNKAVCEIADTIVVHSELAKHQLKGHGDNAVVVPLAAEAGCGGGVRPGKGKVLFFGRIRPYKGLDLFIEAAEKVLADYPDTRFVIAGDGELSSYLPLMKTRASFEIINRHIAEDEAAELFKDCQFVVLPYHSATQSGVVPVAYSFAKPVIVTNVGALPEMVVDKQTGILVTPEVDELSGAMRHLLANPAYVAILAANALAHYHNRYRPEIMVSRLETTYRNIFASRS